ncbi:Heme A synthase [Planctomycetes bacterium Pla163]|uniref:Heme A synthase n=1 Tax=Rohdeia mirabilis TaxID=2528008 RepID=A0A518D234_9BACT|nr:Heme A synthase [Planctomycetes bacterium Pla163]
MTLSPWPRRFALTTFFLTLILTLVGSQVTTTGAGMAVKGWLMAEGENGTYHFMPFFPFAEWFRDHPTAWEHTHRMIGVVVGLAAIGMVVVTRKCRLAGGAQAAAWIALFAIVVQGTVGGFRVLENAPNLAFLHGVLAQVTIALITVAAVTCSNAWQTLPGGRTPDGPRTLALVTSLLVLGQITLGAVYRHGLRNPEFDEVKGGLHMHITAAFVLLGVIIFFAIRVALYANRMVEANPAAAPLAAPLNNGKRRLHALIGTQILLGFAAWMAFGDPDRVSLAESLIAGAHLVVGALVLVQTVALVLWLQRAESEVTA